MPPHMILKACLTLAPMGRKEELPQGYLSATLVLAKAICVHSDHLVKNSFPLTIFERLFPTGPHAALQCATTGSLCQAV